jgi:hypothetical protein
VKQSAKPKAKRSPSIQLTLGKTKSSRSSPADATTTKVNAVSRGSLSSPTELSEAPEQQHKDRGVPEPRSRRGSRKDKINDDLIQPTASAADDAAKTGPLQNEESSTPANSGPGWLGWFSKPAGEAEKSARSAPPSLKSPDPPLPPQVTPQPAPLIMNDATSLPPVPGEPLPTPAKRTWLQMWTGGSAPDVTSTIEDKRTSLGDDTRAPKPVAAPSGTNSSATSGSQGLPAEPSAPPTLPGDLSKSSGWVFWSRDRKADNSSIASNEPHIGEIAVSDTPSQKRPKRASISLESGKAKDKIKDSLVPTVKGPGAAKAKDVSALQLEETRPGTPNQAVKEAPKDDTATPTSAKLPTTEAAASKQLQEAVPSLLLPSFAETFTLQESPSLLQLLSRLLNYNKSTDDKHLHRIRDTPKLKSALAIGVHGYFPAPLIRTVLGQPTGTSIKFADMGAKAIRKWTENHGYSCEVKTAALEGEGRIAERVDLLWKLLLNWIDEIRKADFVMIACHSQGVPVAMMLVAKLVSFGCVNSARVGICAMAGVSLGPFPDLKSRWIGGSAGELFDFSNNSSIVSKDYLDAVEVVLKFGVRVVYVGSIDDQLVSLESSTFSPISHPHIYRAVFVDGRIHAPNFLVHLVGFALKLRNLGVQDHGLIRELSSPLAGSLYSGEGHSRIYEDPTVYDLAVEFALETNVVANVPLSQRPNSTSSSNPYILPWAVRGILEEDFVKSDLQNEANDLLRQFDDWKPTTKALKDVKFRLEGIRSKL